MAAKKISNYEQDLNNLEGDEQAAIVCHLTDLGNGKRLALHFGDKLRYCHDTKCWLAFDGHRWNPETGKELAKRYAKETAIGILDEAKIRPNTHERELTTKWAIKSEGDARINAILSMGESESPISTYSKYFDIDPFQFNAKNFIVDLTKSRCVISQQPEYNITKIGGCEYDEDAICPTWDKCIDEWMEGDKEKAEYLQMILGLCLTSDTSARIFPIFHGHGFNGKSKCLDAVKEIMGDYAVLGNEDLLAEKNMSQHPCDIAKLKGRRLVIVDETKKNMRLRTSLVKRMTGDAELTGRLMRQNYEDFKVTHKTILMTQNLPIITETADAIWDRVHLLKWNHQFIGEERDPRLSDKFQQEYPGILNWLIKGCLKWQAAGYQVERPDSVKMAGIEYRAESDPLNDFIEAKCQFGKRFTTKVSTLWQEYKEWVESEKIKQPVGKRNFNAYLRERGCDIKPLRQNEEVFKAWRGIGLLENL